MNGIYSYVNQISLLVDKMKKICTEIQSTKSKLTKIAYFKLGICTGDYERFGRSFWELARLGKRWSLQQTTIKRTELFGGYQKALLWDSGSGDLLEFIEERLDGKSCFLDTGGGRLGATWGTCQRHGRPAGEPL